MVEPVIVLVEGVGAHNYGHYQARMVGRGGVCALMKVTHNTVQILNRKQNGISTVTTST